MVADWWAAGLAIHGKVDLLEWYEATKDDKILHTLTRSLAENYIHELLS